MLDLRISNLHLQQSGPATGSLIANVTSSDMDGNKFSRAGVVIGTVKLGGASVGSRQVGASHAPVTLTAAGTAAFAGFYEAGEALDALSVTLPLGQASDGRQVLVKDGTGIYATGGTVGSPLAATGAEGNGLALTGLGSLLLGALLLVAHRRRATA
ncbi:HtaA domain-containing protein [Zafaria sp. Z1313]|uniref:HtaA domain-containing protein n=1 Tax=Zafaria sp. Z1313 TaxID=3423202 RepID=UPI003D3023FB